MSGSNTRPKRVVVISAKNDAHLQFVQKYFDEPFTIIDPHDVIHGTELSYNFDGEHVGVSYNHDWLDNVVGVWYRKPGSILPSDLNVKEEYRLYSQGALENHFVQLLTAFSDAHWVSPYYNLIRANNKSLQLALAKQIGFRVPETVITSDDSVARRFLGSHDQCITKPLIPAYPVIGGVQKVLLTTYISSNTATDLRDLNMAPSIFQEAIDIKMEIRAIVVGDHVFAAHVESITNQLADTDQLAKVRDNRAGHYNGSIKIAAITDIPKDVVKLCVEHVERLGLVFGALDLIVDKHDNWWFLENNPNGQWAYIEKETGQPIGKAIADMLEIGSVRS